MPPIPSPAVVVRNCPDEAKEDDIQMPRRHWVLQYVWCGLDTHGGRYFSVGDFSNFSTRVYRLQDRRHIFIMYTKYMYHCKSFYHFYVHTHMREYM